MSLYLNYSSTPKILASMSKEEANKEAWGWKQDTIEWKEARIRAFLTKISIAPGIFKDSHKILKQFQGYQFTMLDFDSPDNVPVKSMVDLLKAKYLDTAWAVFSSNRHMQDYKKDGLIIPGHDKYRVLFPLSSVLKRSQVDDLNTYFLRHYPKLDASCFMLTRYFYRGTDLVWAFNEGARYINTNEICAEVTTLKKNNKIKTYLKPELQIMTPDDQEIDLNDVTEKVIVHCPFHADDTPSAFVDITPNGHVMLHCSACKARGEGTDNKGNYYLQNPKLAPEKVTLFWSKAAHGACLVTPDGDIEKLNDGKEWMQFCSQNNLDPECYRTLRRANITYNPMLPPGLIDEQALYNIYRPSDFMQVYPVKFKNTADKFNKIAPYTYQIIQNLVGDKKDRIEYVLNWFAYLVQTGKQINTGLLFQNRQGGIGKDLLFIRIWTPIFGWFNVQDESGGAIGDKFTGQYAHARLVRFDECFAAQDHAENLRRLQWLKNRITGKYHQVESKGQDKLQMPHYCAYVLHSNSTSAVPIEKNDRRFVVFENNKAIPIMKFSWYRNGNDLEAKLAIELPKVAEYIQSIEVDEELANTAMETEAKTRIQDASQDELLTFADALKERNPDYFEVEDALTNFKLDPLLIKDTVKVVEGLIKQEGAIPTQYVNAIIKHKVGVNVPLAKKILLGFRVANGTGVTGGYFKTSYDGKQYRVYMYVHDKT